MNEQAKRRRQPLTLGPRFAIAPQISTENQCAGRIQGRLLEQLASQTRCDIQAIVMPAAADPLRDYLHLVAGRHPAKRSCNGDPGAPFRYFINAAKAPSPRCQGERTDSRRSKAPGAPLISRWAKEGVEGSLSLPLPVYDPAQIS